MKRVTDLYATINAALERRQYLVKITGYPVETVAEIVKSYRNVGWVVYHIVRNKSEDQTLEFVVESHT